MFRGFLKDYVYNNRTWTNSGLRSTICTVTENIIISVLRWRATNYVVLYAGLFR